MDDDMVWYGMIYRICKELNYNPDQVYQLLIMDCLNWLSFFKERDDYEQKIRDQQNGVSRY